MVPPINPNPPIIHPEGFLFSLYIKNFILGITKHIDMLKLYATIKNVFTTIWVSRLAPIPRRGQLITPKRFVDSIYVKKLNFTNTKYIDVLKLVCRQKIILTSLWVPQLTPGTPQFTLRGSYILLL